MHDLLNIGPSRLICLFSDLSAPLSSSQFTPNRAWSESFLKCLDSCSDEASLDPPYLSENSPNTDVSVDIMVEGGGRDVQAFKVAITEGRPDVDDGLVPEGRHSEDALDPYARSAFPPSPTSSLDTEQLSGLLKFVESIIGKNGPSMAATQAATDLQVRKRLVLG